MDSQSMVGKQFDSVRSSVLIQKRSDLFHFFRGIVEGGDDGNSDPKPDLLCEQTREIGKDPFSRFMLIKPSRLLGPVKFSAD